MNMLLKQARKGFKGLIDENRQEMTFSIPGDSSIPSGWPGNLPTQTPFSGRISHESSRQAPELSPGTAGLSTNLQRFLSVEYTVDFLVIGSLITDENGKQWKLGPIDPLEKFGGIHGYQIPLEEAI